jgi:hypothetical protein
MRCVDKGKGVNEGLDGRDDTDEGVEHRADDGVDGDGDDGRANSLRVERR